MYSEFSSVGVFGRGACEMIRVAMVSGNTMDADVALLEAGKPDSSCSRGCTWACFKDEFMCP